MKNLRLLAFSLLGAGVMVTTSCSDDDDDDTTLGPTLVVTEMNSGATEGSITVEPNTELRFAWDARSGDSDLEVFRVSNAGSNVVNPIPTTEQGNDMPYEVSNADDDNYLDTLVFNSGSNSGNTSYTFTVEDEDGNTESVSFEVTVEPATTELTAAQSFTWEREGSDPATGLAQFGLEWDNNSTQSAIVTTDAATTMVELPSSAWANINTVADLSAAINAETPITEYTGVSSQQSGTYDDVLGVVYNNEVYMIHVTDGTVTSGTAGTTITITGEYRAES